MAVIPRPLSRGKAEAGARRIADHGELRRGDLVVQLAQQLAHGRHELLRGDTCASG